VMAECECGQYWNWWSQPVGFSIIETSHRDHGSPHATSPSWSQPVVRRAQPAIKGKKYTIVRLTLPSS